MDKIQIQIQTTLQKMSDAEIKKYQEQLEKALGKVKVNPKLGKGSGIKLLDDQEIDIYVKKMENAISRLKIGKDKVFANSGVQDELKKLQVNLDLFKSKGDISTKQVGLQFDNLRTKVSEVSNSFKNVNKDGYSFAQMIELAGKKIAIWGISTTLVYGSFRKLKEGITYITELDNSLNEIMIVTGKTQEEVNKLGLSYNKLAKEMKVTTKEITSEAANLFRQGLNEAQVEERMNSIIQYAKISSISIADSDKIITATANSTGESVNKIIDIFALLGDTTSSGADEIGEALQKVASASENSNLSLEKSASWIATISSVTRESASTIGRSLNSVISRYEAIKKTGFNEEDATQLNDVVLALSQVGIVATDSQGQLRDFADVMDELGAKYNSLNKNEQAYIATTLFGTYQRNRGITLLKNYNDSLKNYETALNSAGTAEQKFAIYQQSSQAAIDKFTSTLDTLYQSFISSDFLKSVISGGTEFLNIIDRLVTGLGGFQSVLLLLIPIITTKFLTSLITIKTVEGVLTVSTVGLTTAIKGLGVALTTLATNPITWIVAALGLAVGGVIAYTNQQQKLKEQTEAINKSQSDFNSALEDFNKTLDITKINAATQALEELKKSTNYTESIEQIKQLREEIQRLENQPKANSQGVSLSYNESAGTITAIQSKKEKLAELEEQVKKVDDSQQKLNESSAKAISIDYNSAQQNAKKIALKVKEASENSKLVQQYEVIYNKMQQGIELSSEESQLNEKLISQYPQYVGLIDKKNNVLGVSLEAIKNNTNLQLQLAQVEFEEYKLSIKTNADKTKVLIDETEKRIQAIDAEIKTLDALMQKYDDINLHDDNLTNQKLYSNAYNKSQGLLQALIDARNQLTKLKATDLAYDSILNASFEDLLKGGSTGYIPDKKPDGIDKNPEYLKLEIDRYTELNELIDQRANAVAHLKSQEDTVDGQAKIDLLNQEIEANKELIQAKNDLWWEQKQERNDLRWMMEQSGFSFTGDFDSANMSSNYSEVLQGMYNKYNNMSNKTDADKQARADYLNQIKELEKWYARILQINKDNRSVENDIIALNKDNNKIESDKLDILKKQEEARLKSAKTIEDTLAKIVKQSIENERDKALDLIDDKIEAEDKRHKKQIENYEKEKQAFDDIIDSNIRRLEDQQEASDYNKEISKTDKEIFKLQQRINTLSLDDSLASKKEREELEEELASKIEEKQEYIQKKGYERSKQALADQKDINARNYENLKDTEDKKYEAEKERLQNSLEETKKYYISQLLEGNIYNKARQMLINTSLADLEKSIITYANKYEQGLSPINGALQEMISNLQIAKSLMDASIGVRSYLESKGYEVGYDENTRDVLVNGKPIDKSGFSFNSSTNRYEGTPYDIEEAMRKAGFRDGGVTYKSGLYPLHASPVSPEMILNSNQIGNLFNLLKNPMNFNLQNIHPNLPKLPSRGDSINSVNIPNLIINIPQGANVNAKTLAKTVKGELMKELGFIGMKPAY